MTRKYPLSFVDILNLYVLLATSGQLEDEAAPTVLSPNLM